MLEEIMSKGASSLGEDVPSEREINRLAARTEDEFWMFEQMDEERRKKENYKTRLMEEKEVPEWAYTSETQEENHSKNHFGSVTGKRKRKEAVYSDSLSELQWMKAMESEEEDASKVSKKRKRRDTKTPMSNGSKVEAESSGNKEERKEESGKESEEENEKKPLYSWKTNKKKRSRYSDKTSSSNSRVKVAQTEVNETENKVSISIRH